MLIAREAGSALTFSQQHSMDLHMHTKGESSALFTQVSLIFYGRKCVPSMAVIQFIDGKIVNCVLFPPHLMRIRYTGLACDRPICRIRNGAKQALIASS